MLKEHLIPSTIDKPTEGFVYANEADVLNMALFGMTAKERCLSAKLSDFFITQPQAISALQPAPL